ncbi:MAG TPA: hypothetical protein VNT81_06055 [Vicinamibacterales bacterium]|nr:hypothetical protein [Vicinamibacterales bacterium]
MNRRDFVSRVTLGAAVACTGLAETAAATTTTSRTTVRFVGMMTFIERTDRSFLVATPGQHGLHHMTHVPFLMAKAGSPIAVALGMLPAPGVIPASFDTQLIGTKPADFVYRNLDNTSVEILAGTTDAVQNNTQQMAMLQKIAPGKRMRGNVEKWAATTVSVRGGRLDDSAGHPDAGKLWSFGGYQQRLTDAVNFSSAEPVVIRVTSGTDVRTFSVGAGEAADLWMISAATPDSRLPEPAQLAHTEVLLEYLVDAKATHAVCPDATGRRVEPTEVPFVRPTSASAGVVASGAAAPPIMEICFIAAILLGSDKR